MSRSPSEKHLISHVLVLIKDISHTTHQQASLPSSWARLRGVPVAARSATSDASQV